SVTGLSLKMSFSERLSNFAAMATGEATKSAIEIEYGIDLNKKYLFIIEPKNAQHGGSHDCFSESLYFNCLCGS
ncbi:MAG TPA: hypothetical protein DCZ48_02405, partial [Methylococcaceae bacterium]|nr:hypothetical protein [Methylococcaceae bacterium]